MARFLDPLDVEEIDDLNFRIIGHPFRYASDIFGGIISVPVGFETDFASTWSHKYAKKAGVVHDWLYYSALTSRNIADLILREAMETDGEWTITAWAYWIGVRVGGWVAWNGHRKAGHSWHDFAVPPVQDSP